MGETGGIVKEKLKGCCCVDVALGIREILSAT